MGHSRYTHAAVSIICPLTLPNRFPQPFARLLPLEVVAPGAPVAPLTEEAAQRSGLPRSCMVCGGTTDSIAAFLAAGVSAPGEVGRDWLCALPANKWRCPSLLAQHLFPYGGCPQWV